MKVEPMSMSEGATRALYVTIPVEMHRRLQALERLRGQSVQQTVVTALTRYLDALQAEPAGRGR